MISSFGTVLKHHQGYTLIEWMITIAIGLFLTTGVGGYLVASMRTNEATMHIGEMQARARTALQLIGADLKMAGFWGDFTGNSIVDSTVLTVSSSMSGTDCGITVDTSGYIGTFPDSSGYFLPLWAEFATSTGSSSGFGCIDSTSYTLTTGSDVISVKRLIGNPVVDADSSGTIDSTELDAARHYFMANTSDAEIFAGSVTTPPAITNAQTWEYQHHIYFVATDSDGMPGLYRYYLYNDSGSGRISEGDEVVATNSPVPLIEGVEYLHILFEVDSSTEVDGVVDEIVASDNVDYQSWSEGRVLGAQIFLLMRSLTEDANYSRACTNSDDYYAMGDYDFPCSDDGFRRWVVEEVVSFRNLSLSLETDS